MLNFHLSLSKVQELKLNIHLADAKQNGNLKKVKRCLAILAILKNQSVYEVATTLQVSTESIRQWLRKFLTQGIEGITDTPITGRPPKLTEKQRMKLSEMIKCGPEVAGFPGGCWRTPMIQFLIKRKFGVSYSTKYLSQLLNELGFSYQKATFVAANRDERRRQEWLKKQWPKILKLAKKRNAHILFGDEASFPQWGTLNYTWAPRGEQPIIKTCGSRKAYKVFGLIDYFTGHFYFKGCEEKLDSESYMEFLKEILLKTRKHIILIQDNAPYHISVAMRTFFNGLRHRLTVYQLPTSSPDYNPIEKLWKKIKQVGTHLKYFPTFDSLIDKVDDMLVMFQDCKKEVLSLFGFYNDLVVA